MKKIQVFDLAADDHLIQPEEFSDVTLDTSAMVILTDFRHHKPPMVSAHMEISEAREMMHAEDISLKLVVDDARECVGVISRDDLAEHALLLKQLELRVNRDELLVQDVMHHRHNIRAMDFTQFARATVGDIVGTLEKHHQEYLLVVDKDAHHIRGVVSCREISRRLHVSIQIEKERTFVDIFTAVRVQ